MSISVNGIWEYLHVWVGFASVSVDGVKRGGEREVAFVLRCELGVHSDFKGDKTFRGMHGCDHEMMLTFADSLKMMKFVKHFHP